MRGKRYPATHRKIPVMANDRITELEIEVADLRAQLAELTKPAPAPPTDPPKPRAVVEEGPRVYTVPASNPRFVMPNAGELNQLRVIVLKAVPALAPKADRFGNVPDDAFNREFATAVRAVGTILSQRDSVDHSRGADHWLQIVNEQQRLIGRPSIDSAAFTAGVLALNTRHCIGLASTSFGLTWGGSGRLFTDEWRAVLANGRIRGPDPLPGEYGQWSMGVSSWVRPG
jgi:hypothetical protein